MTSPRDAFARLAAGRDEDIDLATACLWIAAEEYPDLDVAAELARLDALAARGADAIADAESPRARVAGLHRFLHEDEGFRGDTESYYDPRNSYLNQVLERRRGIPITLAIVTMAVAARLGFEIRGVSFPGHFLVRHGLADGDVIADPFEGRLVGLEECEARLQRAVGRPMTLEPDLHLRPATPREILIRVLSNLKQIFGKGRDFGRTLACCERILLLEPDAPLELRDRALVYEQLDCTAAAAADLDRFLTLAPDDPTADAMRSRLESLRARTGRLH